MVPGTKAALLWASSPASASGLAGKPEKQELQLFLGRLAARGALWENFAVGQFLPHTGICSCSQDGPTLPLADRVGVTFSLLSQDSSVCLKSRDTLLPLLPSVHQKLQAVAQACRVSPPS